MNITTLLLLSAIGQPQSPTIPQGPPIVLEKINVAPTKIQDAYSEAWTTAIEERLRLVAFVGTDARKIRGNVTVGASAGRFVKEGYPAKCILVTNTDGSWRATLSVSASDEEIVNAPQQEVSQKAVPFENKQGRDQGNSRNRADDDGPWLPVGEQKKIRDMWPEGVPLPDALKFYKLPRAGQTIASYVGGGAIRSFKRPQFGDINLEFPYIGSGGMDLAKPGTWRNVTGLAIPAGKRVQVWEQHKPVLNSFGSYQQERALFWRFPKGTEAFDVLIRRNDDGTEHIFTVRKRAKVDGESWDDGIAFAPDVDVSDAEVEKYTTPGTSRTNRLFGLSKITYRVAELKQPITGKPRFKESTVAINDNGHFVPPGFKGTGVSCNKCHGIVSLAKVTTMGDEAAPYSGPELAGRDSVYSWQPTTVRSFGSDIPELDYRWPLEVK